MVFYIFFGGVSIYIYISNNYIRPHYATTQPISCFSLRFLPSMLQACRWLCEVDRPLPQNRWVLWLASWVFFRSFLFSLHTAHFKPSRSSLMMTMIGHIPKSLVGTRLPKHTFSHGPCYRSEGVGWGRQGRGATEHPGVKDLENQYMWRCNKGAMTLKAIRPSVSCAPCTFL